MPEIEELQGAHQPACLVLAEQADMWNVPGPPHNGVEFIAERNRVLDEHCAAIGRLQPEKCSLRMTPCTPVVRSTTWDTSKFAAADR